MTKTQAQNFVKNTKYIVWSKEESMALQNKLFEIGCEWRNSGNIVCYTEYPFLYVNDKLMITCNRKVCYSDFEGNCNKYKQTDYILNIEIEQEQPKPKFDPSTLKPFDKVLVRNGDGCMWFARMFDFYENDKCRTTSGDSWKFCIPFNDETKHLHGTREDAPDFYRLD